VRRVFREGHKTWGPHRNERTQPSPTTTTTLRVRAVPRGDDDAEPPGEWSSVRDMIGAARASGFDEEPPPRIDALLMAAARQHAPAPRRRGGAARGVDEAGGAAPRDGRRGMALVVVGVAAGVMYRRGDGEVAQPSVPPAVAPVAKRAATRRYLRADNRRRASAAAGCPGAGRRR
jgi:hypothetical protein